MLNFLLSSAVKTYGSQHHVRCTPKYEEHFNPLNSLLLSTRGLFPKQRAIGRKFSIVAEELLPQKMRGVALSPCVGVRKC